MTVETKREAPWSAAAALPLSARDPNVAERFTRHAFGRGLVKRELRSRTPRLAFGAKGRSAKA